MTHLNESPLSGALASDQARSEYVTPPVESQAQPRATSASRPLLPVFDHVSPVAYPEGDSGEPEGAQYAPLFEVLTETGPSDFHFSCYSCPDIPHRLRGAVLAERAIEMVLLVFDIDPPGHVTTPEWVAGERTKIEKLRAAHPGVFAYETRGGWRLIAGWLPEPLTIAREEDAAAWSAWYLTNINLLKREFGIAADPSCKNWDRLFRVPRALRDGVVQDLPTYGDPANVGTWTLEPDPSDYVEPAKAKEHHVREERPGDPPLEARIVRARACARTLEPAVQGADAETTLLKACNAIFYGYALPREAAEKILEEHYTPRCDVQLLGVEHFLMRMRNKLDQLEGGSPKPWGYKLDEERAKLRWRNNVRRAGGASPLSDSTDPDDAEGDPDGEPTMTLTHCYGPSADDVRHLSGQPETYSGSRDIRLQMSSPANNPLSAIRPAKPKSAVWAPSFQVFSPC